MCGSKENLEHHHVLPLALGGKDEEENLITLCSKHHVQIHNMSDKRIHASELIKKTKERDKKLGKFIGGKVPFGYQTVNGFLRKKDHEYSILKKMILLKSRGLSYRKIKQWLHETHNINMTAMGVRWVLQKNNELQKSG